MTFASPEKNQHVRRHSTKDGGDPSLQTQNEAKKFGFLTFQTDWLNKKEVILHIFSGHARELSIRKKKSAKGVDQPETALPNPKFERDRWILGS